MATNGCTHDSLSLSTNKVNAWTEWGKLNEICVGRADGACYPEFEPTWQTQFRSNPELRDVIPFPLGPRLKSVIKRANVQLDAMADMLEGEGIVVHRTLPMDFSVPVKTPDFESPYGFCNTCPRDTIITLGNVVLEATMSRRSRYFEYLGTRHIVQHLFNNDKKMLWKAAPKPSMADSMYDTSFWNERDARKKERMEKSIFRYPLNDKEPAFDAADMTRMGADVIIQHSAVTNKPGLEWLRRELDGHVNFRTIHSSMEDTPIHIDCTLVPIRPPTAGSRGIMMGCPSPQRVLVDAEMEQFRQSGFDILMAPEPTMGNDTLPVMCEWGKWLSMNLLQISPNKVIIEESEISLAKWFEDLGMEVLKIPYRDVFEFGGSIHCSTWDINRDDEKKSYMKCDNFELPEHTNGYPGYVS
ncbi:glycine amidinotransferase, mitochondrial-like [Sycon ciliatum]|uniref:glycine amidinotransferase, mitochondrial-like n=1 Tax=Sycon ciliatum TaxID=27933 RepID=UPI0031F6D3EA